jgi:hypothetical protein
MMGLDDHQSFQDMVLRTAAVGGIDDLVRLQDG